MVLIATGIFYLPLKCLPNTYLVTVPTSLTEGPAAEPCHLHDHHHEERTHCCCGKCTLVSQVQHSCPLAYGDLQSTLSKSVLAILRRLAGNPTDVGGTIPPPNSTLLLESSPKILLTPNLFQQQCFRFRRAAQCTYVRDGLSVTNLNGAILFQIYDRDKETFKLTCSSQYDSPLVHKHFNASQFHPSHVVVNTRQYSTVKGSRGRHESSDPHRAANLALMLLLLGGDVERNPGPSRKWMSYLK